MTKRILTCLILAFSSAFLLVACDMDPFHQNYRKIIGIYYLHRWEDGKTFYLEKKGDEKKQTEGGGIINGTVEMIGWNADYIAAKRQSTYGGDPSGWMLLDIKSSGITGPFTDEVIKKMSATSGMQFLSADKAWQELH